MRNFFLLYADGVDRIRIFLAWNWELIQDWCGITQENMIPIYDIPIIDATVLIIQKLWSFFQL